MQDSEETPHHFLGHGATEEQEPFPLPFVLVFAGYSFILLIDRVMFDSHALFEHGDDHGHENEGHGDDHHSASHPKKALNTKEHSDDSKHNHRLLEGGADKIHLAHHHGGADPAAHALLEKIKGTVGKIHHDKDPENTFDREIIEEEEIQAEKEIKENIKSYISRND